MLTIARGTLPLALFGPIGYGLRTGILSAPARILQGGAPLLFGLVLDRAGPLWALLLSGTLTSLSFLALFALSAAAPAPCTPARKARYPELKTPRSSAAGSRAALLNELYASL
jgi:hypothetical protein